MGGIRSTHAAGEILRQNGFNVPTQTIGLTSGSASKIEAFTQAGIRHFENWEELIAKIGIQIYTKSVCPLINLQKKLLYGYNAHRLGLDANHSGISKGNDETTRIFELHVYLAGSLTTASFTEIQTADCRRRWM